MRRHSPWQICKDELIALNGPSPGCRGSVGFQVGRRSTDRRMIRSTDHRQVAGKTGTTMLDVIVVILILLWLIGLATSHTMGGLVHVQLAIAIVVILVRVIQGRRPL